MSGEKWPATAVMWSTTRCSTKALLAALTGRAAPLLSWKIQAGACECQTKVWPRIFMPFGLGERNPARRRSSS